MPSIKLGELTERQREALRIIQADTVSGSVTTIRTIGERMGGIGTNGVVCHLRSLRRKGFLVDADSQRAGVSVEDGTASAASLTRNLIRLYREGGPGALRGLPAGIAEEIAELSLACRETGVEV